MFIGNCAICGESYVKESLREVGHVCQGSKDKRSLEEILAMREADESA